MKIEVQTRILDVGRVLRVEVHRDDAGNMIMARLELLPQYSRFPFGGGGITPDVNILARRRLLPQHTRRPRLGLDARLSNTTAENRQSKFDHPNSVRLSSGLC